MKYAFDLDMCPITDEVLTQATCQGCEHYHGFSFENGCRCIECSYYAELTTTDIVENS